MEGVGTNSIDEPNPEIKIIEMKIITDPFDELSNKERKVDEERDRKKDQKEMRQRLVQISQETIKEGDQVGKYLKKGKRSGEELMRDDSSSKMPPPPPSVPKAKKKTGFGSFDGW